MTWIVLVSIIDRLGKTNWIIMSSVAGNLEVLCELCGAIQMLLRIDTGGLPPY